MPEGTPSNC